MRRRGPLLRLMRVVFSLSALSAGCGDGDSGGSAGLGAHLAGEVVVFAAASLTDSFEAIAGEFQAEHPGITVLFSFGPSDGLAQQIMEGAPADVFASASPRWMDEVEQRGPGISHRTVFARNRLVVVAPADDPAGITRLQDLAGPGVKLVLAAEGVPAGDYARQMLERAGILDRALENLVSNEEDVKAVVQKVLLGEADAGVVYRTDVTASVRDRLRVVEVPAKVNVTATYPIAVVRGSSSPDLAAEFVRFVVGPGRAALVSFGFLPP